MYTKNARNDAEKWRKIAEWIDEALVDIDGLDEMSIVCDWYYVEPFAMRSATDARRRAAALEWLRRHNRGIQAIARYAHNEGHRAEVRKISNEAAFGLQVYVRHPDFHVVVNASVPAQLTCELVPTGEVRHIAAHDRPVMERRCPDSIFEGLADEVVA